MSSVSRDSFFFLNWIPFMYFFRAWLFWLEHPVLCWMEVLKSLHYLVSGHIGKAFSLLLLNVLDFSFQYVYGLYYAEVVSFSSSSWVFLNMNLCPIYSYSCSASINRTCHVWPSILLMHTVKFIVFRMLKDSEFQEEFSLNYVVK